jgi:HlyD family secretion protein
MRLSIVLKMFSVVKLVSMLVTGVCLCTVARAQQPAAPVVVATVIEQEIIADQTFVGTVTPMRKSVVGSAVDGRVIEFPAKRGTWVTQDQPLAQLLTNTLEIELAGAKAELLLRQEELDELKNGSLPEEIAQAKAKMLGAEAQSKYTEAKYQRTLTLFQQGRSVSQEELDQANAAAVAADQNYIAAQAALELAVQGPRKEKIAQAEARLLVQQETVNHIEDRLKKYTIRAPFDGYVTAEFTEVGEWIASAAKVAEVIELDPVEIEVFVPENYIVNARNGMPAQVTLGAVPGQFLAGEIAQIVPQADVRSRTFPVRIRLSNPRRDGEHLLKAGMLARVTLPVGGKATGLLVPKDALILGGPKPSVFVVTADPQTKQATVRMVPVDVGLAYGSLIHITGPLAAGNQVVVEGNERLRPGQPVQVVRVVPSGSK